MFDKFCSNCMTDKGGKEICPSCGQHSIRENRAGELFLHSILNDKYLIGTCLGRGGFGITYLGLDLDLRMRVVIKEYMPSQIAQRDLNNSTVRPTKSEYQEDYEYGLVKFLDEARTLAQFYQAVSIVSILSFFKANNTAYFAMPFIPGVTLEQYVKQRNGITGQELLLIMNQIFDGLITIHSSRFLHQDIKPANIYIPDEGPPILLDFGSARQAMMNKENKIRDWSVWLTHGYAPIEQYQSRGERGPYTDIYACAATMYSCLQAVFDENGCLRRIVAATDRAEGAKIPHIRSVFKTRPVNAALANGIMKGLEVQPSRRPQSIQEFKRLLNDTSQPSAPIEKINYDLRVMAGEFENEIIPLGSRPVVLGRSPKKSALVLSNISISSTHCQLRAENGTVYVKDLNSTNGTWINDKKKLKRLEEVAIGVGDTISLAGCSVLQIIEKNNSINGDIGIERDHGDERSIDDSYDGAIETTQPKASKSAGFWKRFVGFFIDWTIIQVLVGISFGVIAMSFETIAGTNEEEIQLIFTIMMYLIYCALMESSKKQATLGKLACSVKVTDTEIKRISFWRALGRNSGKIISSAILGIGFIMAITTSTKQALHDKMTDCFVIKNNS